MKLYLWILIILFILITLRVKIRKYFWKDRAGNKLTFKQFIQRWKVGVQGITPLQSTKTQLMGIWITITGIIAGIVVNILIRLENMWWWILIILLGSLILTGIQFLTTLQKYWKFKLIDIQMKEIEKKKRGSR
jgi:hypothetical protein